MAAVESDFYCSFRANPYEPVYVSTDAGTTYGNFVADANGNGGFWVAASWKSGYYAVCASAASGKPYVCDYIQLAG